jgi:secondary thiamine-phosphate synthase enzyme
MKSHTKYLTFRTQKRKEIVPITDEVERTIRASGIQEGLALVSAMHLTASVIIQDEESGLWQDIMQWAERLAPENPNYLHHRTGEDNGDAHLKNLLLHHQVVLPITNGKIDFGPWQRLFYVEFDGQRNKRVLIKVIGE